MIEEEVHARLADWPGMRAAVGAACFPVEAPTNTPPPYVVHRRNGTETAAAFDSKDTPRARFEIECVATTFRQAKQIATLVIAALDGWTGDAPAAIFSASYEDEEHRHERASGLVSVFLDFDVLYRK